MYFICSGLTSMRGYQDCNPIFPSLGISIVKMRRSWDRLIFIMGIPIRVRRRVKTVSLYWNGPLITYLFEIIVSYLYEDHPEWLGFERLNAVMPLHTKPQRRRLARAVWDQRAVKVTILPLVEKQFKHITVFSVQESKSYTIHPMLKHLNITLPF